MDRIQGVNTGGQSHVTPAAGAGGMTNPVLGAFMNNTNNSTTPNTQVTPSGVLSNATTNPTPGGAPGAQHQAPNQTN